MPARKLFILTAALLLPLSVASCGEEKPPATTATAITTPTATVPAPAPPAGIALDPALKSATGIPTDGEMPALIALQARIPYPVIVPTSLPEGLVLDAERIGGGRDPDDPVAYYSYRYFQPENSSRTITFNQTPSNNRELKGYYLTEEEINGTLYQVYWHKAREYLPEDRAVRTGYIEEPETFVVIWKGQYTDQSGAGHELFYSISTGTWSGLDWWSLRQILESLRPLSEVGQP